ncbi:MAG: 4-(cytidine 5'-diphospho)-2-C-methyl-D-erythritol kinase [Lachnospiraceae bacterium]|nr:4-(cytidine 5'-diphospho)-2-C-methyl-D-erythritol kinase [Lachnospiraceae bacterium]
MASGCFPKTNLISLVFATRKDETISIVTNKEELPTEEDNLIYKAAKLVMTEAGKRIGLDIELKKRIPMAAGMAGGSTDAAQTMIAVNEILGEPFSVRELMEMAVRIGADVPYCIMGKTALAEGIGEVLTPLPAPPGAHILIAKPPIDVSTKYVYEHLKWDRIKEHPDIDRMIRGLESSDLEIICQSMGNVLESVTEKKYKVITRIKDKCKEDSAMQALMSGSGPTVFGVFVNRHDAVMAAEEIKAKKWAKEVYVTGFKN